MHNISPCRCPHTNVFCKATIQSLRIKGHNKLAHIFECSLHPPLSSSVQRRGFTLWDSCHVEAYKSLLFLRACGCVFFFTNAREKKISGMNPRVSFGRKLPTRREASQLALTAPQSLGLLGKGSELRDDLDQTGLWVCLVGRFFWWLINVGVPNSLWATPYLGKVVLNIEESPQVESLCVSL